MNNQSDSGLEEVQLSLDSFVSGIGVRMPNFESDSVQFVYDYAYRYAKRYNIPVFNYILSNISIHKKGKDPRLPLFLNWIQEEVDIDAEDYFLSVLLKDGIESFYASDDEHYLIATKTKIVKINSVDEKKEESLVWRVYVSHFLGSMSSVAVLSSFCQPYDSLVDYIVDQYRNAVEMAFRSNKVKTFTELRESLVPFIPKQMSTLELIEKFAQYRTVYLVGHPTHMTEEEPEKILIDTSLDKGEIFLKQIYPFAKDHVNISIRLGENIVAEFIEDRPNKDVIFDLYFGRWNIRVLEHVKYD